MHATAALSKRLTPEEKERFDREGFLLVRGLIDPERIARIGREIDGLHQRMAAEKAEGVHVSWERPAEGTPRLIKQLMHSEVVSPGLNEVLRREDVLDIVEDLIGPEISLFHSKLLMKAARDGSVTPWHQDFAYWKKEGNRPVQVNLMLAIDRATRENGCIQMVPGTHKTGLISHDRKQGVPFGVYLPGYFQPRPGAVAVEMEPGDGLFFGSLVIHGSDGNHSDRDRRANTFAFTTSGDDPKHFRAVLRSAQA